MIHRRIQSIVKRHYQRKEVLYAGFIYIQYNGTVLSIDLTTSNKCKTKEKADVSVTVIKAPDC